MKSLKKIPIENHSHEKLHLKFKTKPLLDYDDSHPNYKNCSLIAKIYNIKNKIAAVKLAREEKLLHLTATKYFEFLNRPENFNYRDIDNLEGNLHKVILLLQRAKKARIIQKSASKKCSH